MKKISSSSSCCLDLSPIMLKHKFIKDVAIPKMCIELYQNQPINESIGLLKHFSKNSHFNIDISPRELKLEFDQDIFIQHFFFFFFFFF